MGAATAQVPLFSISCAESECCSFSLIFLAAGGTRYLPVRSPLPRTCHSVLSLVPLLWFPLLMKIELSSPEGHVREQTRAPQFAPYFCCSVKVSELRRTRVSHIEDDVMLEVQNTLNNILIIRKM